MMMRMIAWIHKLRILPLFMIAGTGLLVSKIYDVAGALTQPSGLISSAHAQESPTGGEAPLATSPASEERAEPPAPKDNASALPAAQDLMNLDPEQVAVLRALNARPPKATAQEENTEQDSLQLKAIEQRVDQKLGRMQEIQTHLKQLVTQREESEKKDARKLVTMYEKMKPKEAARILEGIDMETLVQLLSQFHETKASAILASMSPEKARVATVWLMHRRQADGFNADIPAAAPAPAQTQ